MRRQSDNGSILSVASCHGFLGLTSAPYASDYLSLCCQCRKISFTYDCICLSRCEIYLLADGYSEKLSSGLLKPFRNHIRSAEEQISSGAHTICLAPSTGATPTHWFTKGTADRFDAPSLRYHIANTSSVLLVFPRHHLWYSATWRKIFRILTGEPSKQLRKRCLFTKRDVSC